MFGFGKKKDRVEKKKSSIDKLIMGAIVGGAIGSVVGMSIAPKKGKETREYIAQKGNEILKKGQEVTEEFAKKHTGAIDVVAGAVSQELPKQSKKLFTRILEKFVSKRAQKTSALLDEENMKKIPHEIHEGEKQ